MDDDALRDLFAAKEPLSFKRMFGGKAIYSNAIIFALVLRNELMLKGDEQCAALYENAGCTRWTYTHNKTGKLVEMPYWSVPEEAMESADDMAPWADIAFSAALRAKKNN